MAKYQLIIEADSLSELLDKILEQHKAMVETRERFEEVDTIVRNVTIPDTKRLHKRWTQMEINFLRSNYATKKISWIAKSLTRTSASVRVELQKLYRLGLPRKYPRMKRNGVTTL